MKLKVNGKDHEHSGSGTLSALLTELDAPASRVAVLVNADVVRRKDFDGTSLTEGDTVEILTVACGG